MKKYFLGLVIFGLWLFDAEAMHGPLPSPFETAAPNPASRLTGDQKIRVRDAFDKAQEAFEHNHKRCASREGCLKADLATLENFIDRHPTHPAKPWFETLETRIRADARQQIFVTQWLVFQHLSPQAQQAFRQGTRIYPASFGARKTNTDKSHYNQDDLLMLLLQKIDHNHKNCEGYAYCLSNDLKAVDDFSSRLASTDPARRSLITLKQHVQDAAQKKTFNTLLYLRLYNPLRLDWYDTLTKHKAKKLAGYGYKEWRRVKDSIDRSRLKWRAIRPASPSSQPVAHPPVSKPDKTASFKNSLQSWISEGKDFFKGWNK